MSDSQSTLAQRLLDGDQRALARAITLVENDDPAGWELVREVYPRTGQAAVLGFTGPPGVGKSTLLAALTKLELGGTGPWPCCQWIPPRPSPRARCWATGSA